MDDLVILEVWENKTGFSPYSAALEKIKNDKTYDQIIKHNEHFGQLTLRQLLRNKTKIEKALCKIKGLEKLWELKYVITSPYRAVCIIQKNKITLLMLMKGSGSKGKLNKFIKKNANTLLSMLK